MSWQETQRLPLCVCIFTYIRVIAFYFNISKTEIVKEFTTEANKIKKSYKVKKTENILLILYF